MAFATAADLEARWRALSPEEEARVDVLLADAAWWLGVWFKTYGDLVALAAADEQLADGLKILSCNMVRRAMTSAAIEGAQSVYQVMGPFTSQIAFRNPDGTLFVYDSERDAILSLLGVNVSGAVSMSGPGL
ncbi:Gp19/Gp15/Gp42 family protein [Nocardia sp. NPDC050793]|uniref:Gp19/Gp15/Gp42 family protein n=1 Tax=Nocardia sp. NPDC050793 TaxID=3155159 RepID=UPI0033F4ED9A